MIGEVGRREMCTQFEAPDMWVFAVFVFSKKCASGEKGEEGKQKKKGERKGIYIY